MHEMSNASNDFNLNFKKIPKTRQENLLIKTKSFSQHFNDFAPDVFMHKESMKKYLYLSTNQFPADQ